MAAGNTRSLINVTPLIDVLLVLMMILMVITPLASHGLPTAVPQPAPQNAPPHPELPLLVKIDRDGHYALNGEAVADAELDARLKRLLARRADGTLFVDGDPELPYADVARLVDRVRGLGFSRTAILPSSAR